MGAVKSTAISFRSMPSSCNSPMRWQMKFGLLAGILETDQRGLGEFLRRPHGVEILWKLARIGRDGVIREG